MKKMVIAMQSILLSLAIPAVVVSASNLAQAANKPTNTELKIGMTQEFENLNPVIAQMTATSYIQGAVLRFLVGMTPEGEYFPELATVIPTLENGLAKILGEGKTRKLSATWEMRSNATWGDGVPVTGHDIRFAWTVALSKNVSVGNRDTYSKIEDIVVDKKNPKKFTMFFKKAEWSFNQMLGFPLIPKHIEEEVFKKYGDINEGYEKNSKYVKDPTNRALYNGPFAVSELKLGSHVVLVRNPRFYGTQAKIEKLILKVIPNSNTLEANLRSGNIDMISTLGLPFDQAVAFQKKVVKEGLDYEVKFKPGLVYEHVDLQLHNPILQDIRVRRALVYGVNRPNLSMALFAGLQKPAIHSVAPMDPWFTDDPKDISIYKYSRRKAKGLLERAGWKAGKDGFRRKAGKKLSLQIMTTSGNKTRELVENYLKDQWKKIGVDIVIKNEPARVFFGETVRKAKYPAMAMYAWISSPENPPRSSFHSENIPEKKNGYSGQNSMGWSNPNVDKLLEEIEVEFDAEKRKAIMHRILGYYTSEVPAIPLYYRSDVAVVPANLVGHILTGHQEASTGTIENWELK